MKYDYYAKKLEALWLRRKWWILGVGVLVSASAIVANIMLDTPESRIKKALIEYHQAKGQTVEIKDLSFRAVSPAWPDSMLREYWYGRHDFFIKQARFNLGLYGPDSTARFHDSLDMVEAKAHSFDARIDSLSKTPATLTKCDYVAVIKKQSEQYTDTLSVVLNNSLFVVWPTF